MENSILAHSPACERNTPPLLEFLKKHLSHPQGRFLEIGFGTGQHAFAFSQAFPELSYFAADQKNYHAHLEQRKEVLGAPKNLFGPFELYATETKVHHNLPSHKYSCVFSANTLHIMSWHEAKALLKFLPSLIEDKAELFLYGPFKFNGAFTSDSNQHFDLNLKAQAPHMGIREFEDIKMLLEEGGLCFQENHNMPANNNILVFTKKPQ